jgi:cytochrome c oxidase subunit 3
MDSSAELVVGKKHQDVIGAKLGMWLFLFTELLLFGGVFLLYSAYRSKYPQDFHNAALEMDVLFGAINTIILLTSSLTVALSIGALQRGNKKASVSLVSGTIFLGLVFLVNKYFEWSHHISLGIFPNSAEMQNYTKGEGLYYGLYYAMTGLHGLHVIIGLVVLGVILYFIVKKPRLVISLNPRAVEQLRGSHLAIVSEDGSRSGPSVLIDEATEQIQIKLIRQPAKGFVDPANVLKLENAGLYWHLVDIIWIFLFPLFYLIT